MTRVGLPKSRKTDLGPKAASMVVKLTRPQSPRKGLVRTRILQQRGEYLLRCHEILVAFKPSQVVGRKRCVDQAGLDDTSKSKRSRRNGTGPKYRALAASQQARLLTIHRRTATRNEWRVGSKAWRMNPHSDNSMDGT